ncbi:hypothetical protein HGRIS_007691 [Hohenbuehelia grisea]|uniref:Uncharacterized protein n=1 Tax=Hohenbuehelia grisea TaxID=104357 RepID=A0ABR3J716_9AGAR
MDSISLAHIPQISISPAPEPEPIIEPYSPFSTSVFTHDDDAFRPQHLTPPPTGSQRFSVGHSSPLRPAEAKENKGLDSTRFMALLKASKERNSSSTSRKENDLRKEIALKAHKNKQLERRAMFLSKVMAPPSPTATSTPKTPPESPAIFHYTLPSPGLVSPLALFETLNENPAQGPVEAPMWVEQVDFRVPGESLKVKQPRTAPVLAPVNPLPSLDQISARMRYQKHRRTSSTETETQGSTQVPALLYQTPENPVSAPATERIPKLTIGVGRLQMPLRETQPAKAAHLRILPPASPRSPLTPNLQVTTQLVPRTATTSPTKLSELNLLALNSRTRRASDMMSTLRRRVLPSEYGHTGHDAEETSPRHWKRRSAPAELVTSPREGFQHPVLSLPGGF